MSFKWVGLDVFKGSWVVCQGLWSVVVVFQRVLAVVVVV